MANELMRSDEAREALAAVQSGRVPPEEAGEMEAVLTGGMSHIELSDMLSDLRQSGSIEQDADVVAMLYREAYYTSEEQWEKREAKLAAREKRFSRRYPRNVTEVLLRKQRQGPTCFVELVFHPKRVRFESLSRQGEDELW